MSLVSIRSNNVRKTVNYLFLFSSITASFIIIPVGTVVLIYFYLISRQNKQSGVSQISLFLLWCLFLALYNGLINSTKVASDDPDLTWYYMGYLYAGTVSFLEYILTFGINGQGKELAFPVFNFLVYQVFGESTVSYMVVFTTVTYFLMNYSVYRFCSYLGYSSRITATAIMLMSFNPFLFSISAVILRQTLGAAILIYLIVEKVFYGKNNYIGLVIMFLVHTSTLFFIPLLIFPFLKKSLSIKSIPYFLVIVLAVMFYQQIAGLLSGFFSGDNALGYALGRASKDTTFNLPPLGMGKIGFILLLNVIPFWLTYFINREKYYSSPVTYFFNILAILSLFILVNLSQIELSVRFYFYVLLFFPFVFAFMFKQIRLPVIVYPSIAIFFIMLFFYGIYTSMWSYNSIDQLVILPAIFYFL